jgi:Flp pilus assembly pilin Flp
MGLIALFLGIILIVAAVRNSQGALFSALGTDVPKFVIWGAAIIAVGMIGAIPGLKTPSRLLLGLVVTVLIVNNYQKLISGFQSAWQSPPKAVAGAKTEEQSAASAPDWLSGFEQYINPFSGDFLAPPQ